MNVTTAIILSPLIACGALILAVHVNDYFNEWKFNQRNKKTKPVEAPYNPESPLVQTLQKRAGIRGRYGIRNRFDLSNMT